MANSKKAQERAAKAAALQEAERRRAKRNMILRVGGVVVAMVVIIGVLFAVGQNSGDEPDSSADSATAGKSEYGLTMGEEDAPRKLVIYEDFLCPYCGELERASSEELEKLAEDGKVFVDYRPFVLLDQIGPYSADATNAFAVVKKEAGDEVALKFHQLLFANQPPENSESFPGADELVDLAVEAGADEDAVRPGIEDGDEEDWADGATQEAQDNGIQGTPTILLDGEQFQEGTTVDEMVDNLITELS